jgi:microcystin-dependent protein
VADPFVAEIRIFAGNFAPTGWAFCDGQLMPISQNTALFALLGTTYGGDGQANFALPDLRDRAPMHPGQGVASLRNHTLGERGGAATVKLTKAQMPSHNHGPLSVHDASASSSTPSGGRSLAHSTTPMYAPPGQLAAMGDNVGGQAHENRQPYLGLTFIIALQGIFPSRN